jgi:uncharacterized protein YdeI (YjbR/CyaY-like superfamily)
MTVVAPVLETRSFATPAEFRAWLVRHHGESPGVWLRFFKKASGRVGVNYAEALDEALCFGWIDGQVKRSDAESYLQRFTPRRAGSSWSKRNTEHAERLLKANLVMPAGLAAIESAKRDGRWAAAYDSPRDASVPADLLALLATHKKADAFFKTLNKANLYAITYRLQTAKKPETRARRMAAILEMLERGEAFH